MVPRVIERLDEPVPRLGEDAVAALLRDAYGVGGTLRRLAGERDLNHAVDERYVLKVQNATDGEDVIEFSSLAIAELGRREPGLPVAQVVPARDGALWRPVEDDAGRTCFARLFTFLGGHHPEADELDERALHDWARTAARVGRGLRGFFHPAARYEIAWDVARAADQRADAGVVADADRAVVATALDRFAERVAPVLGGLRAQVVHNDLGRANVLVDDDGAVSGIIDFGDMTHTALVCDLAVTVADVVNGRTDALGAIAPMIAGYRSVTPLGPEEADVLGDLIAARLAITAVIMSKHVRGDDVDVLDDVDGAVRLLHEIDALGFARFAADVAAHARGDAAGLWAPRGDRDLRRARDRALGPQTLTYDVPLHVVRGEGAWLIGADGRRYLDAYNNVPVVGHCHPEVVRATAAQLATLNTNTRYLHEGERRARRAADRIGAARARPRAVRQLGQRGERPRAAHRALRHRPPRRAGDALRVPRHHRGDVRALARELAARRRAAGRRAARPARTARRAAARGPPRRRRGVRAARARGDRGRRLVHQRRHARPGARLDPADGGGHARPRRALRRRRGPGRLRPHRGGAVERRRRRASRRTSSRSASRWATASRSPR